MSKEPKGINIMEKLNKKVKLTTLIVGVLFVVLLLVTLANVDIDWANASFGSTISSGFKYYADIYDFSSWTGLNWFVIFNYVTAIVVTVVGLAAFIFWLFISIVAKKRKFGIIGAFLCLGYTIVFAFLIAELSHDFSASILGLNPLAVIAYILLIISIVAICFLF